METSKTGSTARMRSDRSTGIRRLHAGTALLLVASLLVALPSAQAARSTTKPRASTGGVNHVRGTTGQLNGVINPNGLETSYFFQYGPTVAYGSQTKSVAVGKGVKTIKVGQSVTGLLPGYHYRIAASFLKEGQAETVYGKDKSFTGGKSSKLKFVVAKGKEEQLVVSYGGSLDLTGSLTGLGNANHPLSLQATPFPYTAAFTTLAGPVLSTRTGSFLFKLSRLTRNTEFRVLTSDARPLYSPVITVHVTPRIVLHVRSAGRTGLYRFYGTVAPAHTGTSVTIQQLRPQKTGSKRSGPQAHSVGTTALKRATSSLSRFSVVLSLSGTYHYRAYVKLAKGALESGHSANLLVKAPRSAGTGKHGKKK